MATTNIYTIIEGHWASCPNAQKLQDHNKIGHYLVSITAFAILFRCILESLNNGFGS